MLRDSADYKRFRAHVPLQKVVVAEEQVWRYYSWKVSAAAPAPSPPSPSSPPSPQASDDAPSASTTSNSVAPLVIFLPGISGSAPRYSRPLLGLAPPGFDDVPAQWPPVPSWALLGSGEAGGGKKW